MARASSQKDPTVKAIVPGGAIGRPRPAGDVVPGQLIVRFKPAAVREVAAHPVAMAARAAVAAAAMPDEVAGPLALLKAEAGMVSVKPLFVTGTQRAQRRAGPMAMAAVHGMLARSATRAPEALNGFQLVEVSERKLSPALVKRIQASRAVEFVEPVPSRWMCAADPRLNRQWGLQAVRWFDAARPDASKVSVAVLDSGIDKRHEDLKKAIDVYRHDGNKTRDYLGHGTHVAGIIAAVVNNSVGIAGVANCRIHAWKIFDDPPPGGDQQNFNFDIYSTGLASALDSDVKVVNLSIGGTASSQTEAAVFRELREAGVVVVAAMGNEFLEGNPKEYPGGYDGVLAIGAVDESNRRAAFSCTGKHIGLVAPGVNVLSTVPRVKAAFATATNYDSWPGTSMATPHVAGTAALMYARVAKSKEAADAIVAKLKAKARKVPGMKGKAFTNEYGFGLLDVAAALK